MLQNEPAAKAGAAAGWARRWASVGSRREKAGVSAGQDRGCCVADVTAFRRACDPHQSTDSTFGSTREPHGRHSVGAKKKGAAEAAPEGN
jgi:hypothetical protein